MGSITVGPSYSTSQARPQIPYHFYAHPNPLPLILGNSRFYCSERPSKNAPAKLTTGRSIDTGTGPFLEQRTTSGMTAPGTQHSALDTAPISTSNKVGGSLRRLPHQALSMPNTGYDDHPYEMPRGMRYPYTDVRRLGMATPSDAVDTSPTIQEIPPAPSTRTHSLMSSTAPPVPPRLATRKVIQTSPASTENITALSHRRYSQAGCPVPTTTTCSTPGSRTAERDDQADISIRPILRQPTGLRRTTPSYLLSLEEAERAAVLGQQDEAQQSPSSQFTPIRQEPPPYRTRIHIEPNQSPQPATTQPPSASSTQPTSMPLIAFPNTRHAFMATLATASQPRNTQERLSVRARKKVNRQSMLAKT